MRQLWPYLDGALPEALQDRVAEHMTQCANCRSHFEFASSFLTAIQESGGTGVAVDVDSLRIRILAALAAASDGGP
ncbi:MAG TPA: zf-HC2 domain-containing protein [Gemmatimonadaceae bacterium]|nr:zf-HC2 domain-containing protein [Gemmatimonadaceae bacterium]